MNLGVLFAAVHLQKSLVGADIPVADPSCGPWCWSSGLFLVILGGRCRLLAGFWLVVLGHLILVREFIFSVCAPQALASGCSSLYIV